METSRGTFRSDFLLGAPGREGAYWFREKARSLGVETGYGAIDIGCRVEVASAVYDEITAVLYDPKLVFTTPTYQDRTRTFCTNPGGRVRVEEHRGFRLVNGDALKAQQDRQHQLRPAQHGQHDRAAPGHHRDGPAGRPLRQLLGRRRQPGLPAPG